MVIPSKAIVSMREANQNFSAVARMADEKNAVVIMKQNKPAYVVFNFDFLDKNIPEEQNIQLMSAEEAEKAGGQIITEYIDVFRKLAE